MRANGARGAKRRSTVNSKTTRFFVAITELTSQTPPFLRLASPVAVAVASRRRRRNQNLWILDQHGCDEKFNFEKMIRETKIHEQRLIAPLRLELSPSEEDCVVENMEIFEANGFR